MPERSEDLTDLEAALSELRPQPATFDRAVLMYRAGRASARGWGWRLATLLSTSVALTLGILVCLRPAPTAIERTIYVAVPTDETSPAVRNEEDAPASDVERGAWSHYLRLQQNVLRDGLNGLPDPPSATEKPPNLETLLPSL